MYNISKICECSSEYLNVSQERLLVTMTVKFVTLSDPPQNVKIKWRLHILYYNIAHQLQE
jgi:hypothetical protein